MSVVISMTLHFGSHKLWWSTIRQFPLKGRDEHDLERLMTWPRLWPLSSPGSSTQYRPTSAPPLKRFNIINNYYIVAEWMRQKRNINLLWTWIDCPRYDSLNPLYSPTIHLHYFWTGRVPFNKLSTFNQHLTRYMKPPTKGRNLLWFRIWFTGRFQ